MTAKKIWDKLLNFLFVGLCAILISACGSEPEIQELDALKMADVQEENSKPATESNTPTDYYKVATGKSAQEVVETRVAYQAALTTILNELKLPDGSELYYDGFEEFSVNKFAICDVDDDGKEELVFLYMTGPMAAMGMYVYGYDTEADKMYTELAAFSIAFYDNGVAICDHSHNHGRGEQLWPYTVYYYNEVADDYRFGVDVDSWEKAYYGDAAQGTPFPAEADTDGDGIVYYLMPYDDYSYENPVDGAAYKMWYESLIDGAEAIQPQWIDMTKGNIATVTTTGATDVSSGTESATAATKEDVYAGTYVDKQGTDVVYSELKLEAQGGGVYRATIGLYRLTTLEGTAKVEGDKLLFADDIMGIKGEITIKEGKAVLTITESSFEYITVGETFDFPEKI